MSRESPLDLHISPPAGKETRRIASRCDTDRNTAMSVLNVRVDSEMADLVERIAARTRRTKSEVVREVLQSLKKPETAASRVTPYERIKHLIGCWDSRGMNLSEHTGKRFTRMLLKADAARGLTEVRDVHRTRRRRPTRRPH